MKAAGLKITVEGIISDFLGVNIKRDAQGNIYQTQPQLIDSILSELNLNGTNVKGKLTPAATSKLLHLHADVPPYDGHFHYWHVIGKFDYLEKCTRPDIAFAVHQCAGFLADPCKPHANTMKWQIFSSTLQSFPHNDQHCLVLFLDKLPLCTSKFYPHMGSSLCPHVDKNQKTTSTSWNVIMLRSTAYLNSSEDNLPELYPSTACIPVSSPPSDSASWQSETTPPTQRSPPNYCWSSAQLLQPKHA